MYTLPALHTTKVAAASDAPLDAQVLAAVTGPARANRANVIEGAQSIERLLEKIITLYFFPTGGEKAEEFRSLIVETDTCSFAAKRRLVMWLVKKRGLLAGQAMNDHEKLLGDAMRFRNAFAHGGLSSDGGQKGSSRVLLYGK